MDQVQPGADAGRASNYRVYDCLLGGTDNLAVDRVISARVLGAAPEAPRMVLANRAFLRRVVRFLAAEAGIGRFLDIGSGLSARGLGCSLVSELSRTILRSSAILILR